MAGDDDADGDDANERADHFFDSYGVNQRDYAETVRAAIDHATAPGRPNFAAPPWVNIGPRNVAGRILSIAQDPKNPLVVWAGSHQGGLWRTIDGGDTWEHVGTPKENFPVATIAIPDDDPTTVYIGTGVEITQHPGGVGLFKVSAPAPTQPATYNYPPLAAAPSPTTSPAGAAPGSAAHYARIRMDPYDSRRFWVASMTGLWRYESFLAQPFTLEFPIPAPPFAMPQLSAGAAPPPGLRNDWPNYATDVLVSRDPTSNDTEGGKPRYLFVYVAIDGQGVFRGRFDRRAPGSLTWQKQLGPFPSAPASFGRITLAQCRNFPQNVYAVFEDTTALPARPPSPVQSSTDNGDTWTGGNAIPAPAQGQANYDLTLEVNPDNPAKLFCGAVELCYSEDTGQNWSQLTVLGRYEGGDHADHSDHHALVFDSLDRTRVWSGNDGGLMLADDVRSVPRPRFWRHRSHGIVAGQFNSIDVNPRFPFITGGGLQDNGSWMGFGGPTWMHTGGGDGGQTAFNSGNPRQWAVSNQRRVEAAGVILHVPAVSPPFVSPGNGSTVNPTMPDLPIGVMQGRKDSYPVVGNVPFTPRVVEHPNIPGAMLASGAGGVATLAFWLSAAPAPPPLGTPLPPPPLAAPVVLLAGPPPLMATVQTSAVSFGPLINGATDAWLGTNDGHVFVSVNSLGQPTPFTPTAALPRPGGIRQVVTDMAAHPSDPRTVAVAVIPDGSDPIVVTLAGPAAAGPHPAGTVTFTYSFRNTPGTFGVGGLGGAPIVTLGGGAGMIIFGTTLVLTFSAAGNFAVGDTFSIDPLGNVTPGGGNTSTGNVTATSTNGQVITISVATAGAFPGPATFNMSMGGARFSGNPIPMGARVSLPGTFVEVFFPNGNYVAGSSWTISPLGVVASTGAGGSPLPSAVVNPGGRVYMTWDRGTTWTDFTFTAVALPRPNPDLFALPPAPVTSLAWNPTAAPSTGLFAGTLAGVYVTSGVPAPATGGLTITPAGPTSIRPGAANALQLRASLQMTSGGQIEVTNQVDWSAAGPGVTVSPGGLVTGVNAGLTVVTARRGVLTVTINVTVAAGAPATPPPAAALPLLAPAVNPGWAPMNQAIPPNPNNEGLPLTLVNDVIPIGTRLRVATFGRGIWETELTPGAQTRRRLYIRQTAVEDGLTYPRVLPVVGVPPPAVGPPPAAPTLATDPRVPQAPAAPPFAAPTVTLDFTHGFDIRVDTAPFRFFDDRIDGVEFEQQIGVGLGAPAALPPKRPLTATEKAVVYVQVLDSGFDSASNVDVHLYYFPVAGPPIAGGVFPPAGVPVPALNPVTDFYNPPNFDPPSPPNPALWRRVAPRRQLARVSPTAPAVARFEWEPDASLGGQDVALLAMCTSVDDPLPAAPAGGGAVAAFLQQERRASLRLVHVDPTPVASIYIRDGVDDDGRNGAVAFAGRSPDIIVVQAAPVAPTTPEQAFADLLDQRPQSRLKANVANTIYVRVHNRSPIVADAQVELWAVPVEANNQTHATPPVAAPWLQLWPPAGPLPPPLHVPAKGWALQPVTWNNPPDPFAAAPAASKAWVLVALVSAGVGDPRPDVTRIDGVDGLWRFLRRQRDSENAAARALRYEA